jgi:hypothetical protein
LTSKSVSVFAIAVGPPILMVILFFIHDRVQWLGGAHRQGKTEG